jgi:hypothetical protein
MLEFSNGGMTTTEYESHFSLWAMLAAPLIAGNDLSKMDADTLRILTNKDVIAVDQDPLGQQGRRALKGARQLRRHGGPAGRDHAAYHAGALIQKGRLA